MINFSYTQHFCTQHFNTCWKFFQPFYCFVVASRVRSCFPSPTFGLVSSHTHCWIATAELLTPITVGFVSSHTFFTRYTLPYSTKTIYIYKLYYRHSGRNLELLHISASPTEEEDCWKFPAAAMDETWRSLNKELLKELLQQSEFLPPADKSGMLQISNKNCSFLS